MLDAAQYPLETNIALALVHEPGGENDRALVNVAVASSINLHGTIALAAAQAARDDGNAPNAVMAAAACLVGPRRMEPARRAAGSWSSASPRRGSRTPWMRPSTSLQ